MNGKIATLNRFVSRAMNRCLPFFRTLRRSFAWTDECQMTFDNLKKYLLSPPLLSPSKPGEELYLYLAISQAVVSATLVREEDRSQRPVYFTSRALRGTEERYPQMEKLAFALITTARKLKPLVMFYQQIENQVQKRNFFQVQFSSLKFTYPYISDVL